MEPTPQTPPEKKDGPAKRLLNRLGTFFRGKPAPAPPEQAAQLPDAAPAAVPEADVPQFGLTLGADEGDANLVPVKGNDLILLYHLQRGLPLDADADFSFHLGSFMEPGQYLGEEERFWLQNLSRTAKARLEAARATGEDIQPLDAAAHTVVAKDRMSAWLFVFPPVWGGKEADMPLLHAALQEKNVQYGIDEERLATMLDKRETFRFVRVAGGVRPIDGDDGHVIDHFKRAVEISLKVKDNNTIDYKDLGWLQTVKENDLICDIIPPTEAIPGSNVLGTEIKGKNGVVAKVPKGPGTRLNEDKTTLLAAQDGVLSFVDDRFTVVPLLIIEGDVETATGNLNVMGDLLINGDVKEGFSVEATGNITVQGMVEGARIKSGGHIQVGRGMNGNVRGTMRARGDILCKFIENATVHAEGRIICDTIINSVVASDDNISVCTGRGSIIGGSITALNMIEALAIGNEGGRNTQITLGRTAGYLIEKQELEESRAEAIAKIEDISKDIQYLENGSAQNTERGETLGDLRLQLSVLRMQIAKAGRGLAGLEQVRKENNKCRLRAETIYPPAQLTLGPFSKTVRTAAYNASVFIKEGEVYIGST